MNSNYAVISEATVVNIIVWDGEAELILPEETTTQIIEDGVFLDIGYAYSKKKGFYPKD